jgi:hypothetical protein
MVLDRLLWWLFWIAVMLLALYAIMLYSSSMHAPPPPTPEKHRLLHHWWIERGGGWVPDIPIYDRYGCYFFKDLRVNVGALAVLRTKGILARAVHAAVLGLAAKIVANPTAPYDVYVKYTYDSCDPCTFLFWTHSGWEMRSHNKDHLCGTFGPASDVGRHVNWIDLINCVNSALR